jgi:beta-lactamase regulating signal transducer with metallopeptidase domain
MNLPMWFSNMLSWAVQVGLLALAAALLLRLFRIRDPRFLLVFWRSLLVVSLALPLLQPWHRPASITAVAVIEGADTVSFSAPPPAPAHGHFPDIQVVSNAIGIAMLAGILLRFALLALGLLKLRRFREASTPIADAAESAAILKQMRASVGAVADFRLSRDVESPVTFGLAKPVILLPERFLATDARFQSAIACHELLHVRRRDWAHHLAEEIVRASLWFHPAIAWFISRVRLAREQLVDLEVLTVTSARKVYLEALLEFTGSRTRMAAVPAPPFLAECQLVERVALMLKEVRMSRGRLIASFAGITCCLALAVVLAVWIFPLKAAPLPAQSAPKTGITGGVAGGVSGTMSGGVSGGVNAEIAKTQGGGESSVAYNTIWTDTVKRGAMLRQVRGLGKLVSAEDSTLVARITLPVYLTVDVRPNQSATVDTRMGLVKGHVVGINPSGDTCSIDVALDAALPARATVGLSVDATMDIEKLENVLYVGRPVHGDANTTIGLFKISKDGLEAQRVSVKLGRSSVNTIEILDGLQPGDKIILSDMSDYDNVDRIRLTDQAHLEKH